MNKTLIVLGVGIWCVILLLRFVPWTSDSNALLLFHLIEIVAFVITVIGIVKRD